MASYFAELDENKKVLRVIVAEPDVINSGIFGDPNNWKKTDCPDCPTKNRAKKGGTYDPQRDAFIDKKPYPSWTLDENTIKWKAPKEKKPKKNPMNHQKWNEEVGDWEEIDLTTTLWQQ